MLKNYFILAVMLLSGFTAGAQTNGGTAPQYAQTDALRAPNRINERPRYGGLIKTAQQLEADKKFVAESLQRHGNAQAAAQAHVKFGWHYLATGHAPTAIKRFNQAWLLDSTAADVYYGFSAYLRQENRPDEAAQYEQLARRHDTDGKAVLRYYGSLAMGKEAQRDVSGAIALYDQIVQLDAKNVFATKKLGYWYMQQDTTRAVQYLSRAVALDPQDSVSYLNRGWLRYGQQQYARAVADFTRAIQINPYYISAYANRAQAYADAGNPVAAIADWQTCLELVPPADKTPFYSLIAQVKLKANDPTGACAAWREALKWAYTPAEEKEIRRALKSSCR